jgi:iron complex outermembrane receptor protein
LFKRSRIQTALLLAFGGAATLASAQEVQRVEITGSAIKRIDAETALPVQVLRREDIERSGATSTVDLLQRLAVVQGSTHEAANVGGSTFGFSGVSIHNIGETRTLVLLNGRRLTLFGGQSLTGSAAAVDLNAIPVAAIERIEILTDGASALYGSDAIAGVVNFITKRDTTDGDITVGFSAPRKGAVEQRISLSKGFGSLAQDGYNLFFAVGADKRNKLDAVDRSFARTGIIDFTHQGQRYNAFLGSPRSIPANALDNAGNLISPYLIANGSCPPQHAAFLDQASGTTSCYFDFSTQLEIFPTRERQSAIASFTKSLGQDHTLTADLMYSNSESTARIAPVPGGVSIPAGSALHNQYLLPLGITADSQAIYRVMDLGKRTNFDRAEFTMAALGLEGRLGAWDYQGALTHSRSEVESDIAGYPGARAFVNLLSSGLIDPFVGPGQQTAAGLAGLQSIAYKGYWDGGSSQLTSAELRGSRELTKLANGALLLGAGVNYYQEKFQSNPSLFAQALLADPVAGIPADPANGLPGEVRFGDESATIPYGADRNVTGAFVELVAPLAKGLEVTGSARYDKYSDFGNATTAKASARWTPTPGFLMRASVGTGFKAPTVPQLRASLQQFGVTSEPYACSPEMAQIAASLNATCRPGTVQYDQFAGGNPLLQPEKSRQATIGFRLEPSASWSVGADLWHVAIRDAFGQITEDEVFANPLQYPGAWTTAVEVSTGNTYLAFNASNQNLGKQYSTGIDFDLNGRWQTPYGQLRSQLLATYMLRERVQLQIGGTYFSAIGNNAELGTVTFRWQGKLSTSLQAGAWTHTLGLNFKSGYRDAEYLAERYDAAGNLSGVFDTVRLKVKPFYSVDWQTAWAVRDNLQLTVGLLNLFDKDPPLSLAEGGLNKGQMFGYDDRYYDSRGRTVYANLSFKF